MNKSYSVASLIYLTFPLIALVGCGDNLTAIKQQPTISSNLPVAPTSKLELSAIPPSSNSEAIVDQASGNLLSSDQKAQLKQLGTPIAAPTYLPAGFRLHKFGSGKEELRTDSIPYYSIFYAGENDTCLDISLNTDPAMSTRRLQKTQMQSPVSREVNVLTGDLEGRPIVLGLFKLPNGRENSGYMLRTGGWLPSNDGSKNIRCNAVSTEEYVKVLQALEVLDLDGIANIPEPTSPTTSKSAIATN